MVATVVELRRTIDIVGRTSGVKEATADLQKLGSAHKGLAVESAKVEKATLSVEKRFQSLQRSLDPAVRSAENLARAERTLNSALSAGLVTKARHAELMALATKSHGTAAVAATTHARALNGLTAATVQTRTALMSLVGLGGGAIFGGFAALAGSLALFTKNSIEAQKSLSQLRAVLSSTNGAAGMTEESLLSLAAAMQRTTTFGDDAVVAAEAMLLTFTKVGRDVFPQATQAILDMATAMNSELQPVTIQVGKALNDPIKGVTALSKVGVTFTTAQREMIRALVETGNVADAQRLILRELATEFGGSAAAARDTLGGALQSLSNSFGDLFEVSSSGSRQLVSAINSLTDALSDPEIIAAIQGIGAALFDAISFAVEQVRIFMRDLQNLKEELRSLGNIVFPEIIPITSEQRIAGLQKNMADLVEESKSLVDVIVELRTFTEDPTAMLAPGSDAIVQQLAEARQELAEIHKNWALTNFQIELIQKGTQAWESLLQSAGRAAEYVHEAISGAASATVDLAASIDKIDEDTKAAIVRANNQVWFDAQTKAREDAERAAKKAADEADRAAQRQADALRRATEEQIRSAQRLLEVRKDLIEDIAFERDTMFLSDEDVAIAQRLRSIYGSDIPAALSSWEAGQIRVNNALAEAKSRGEEFKDALSGAIAGLFDGSIKSLDDFLDKLTGGIAKAAAEALGRKLTDTLFGGGTAVDLAGFKVASALDGAASKVTSAAPTLTSAANTLGNAAAALERAASALGGAGSGLGISAAGGASGSLGGKILPISTGPGALTDVKGYITQRAMAMGIDPSVALAVAASEGGIDNKWRVGDAGKSFGPYQLYTGGGLGNVFQKEVGLPLTPNTVRQQIDFALNKAAEGGWGPWYGWKGSPTAGLSGARTLPVSPSTGFSNNRDATITGGMAPGGWSVGAVSGNAVPVSVVSTTAPAFTGISKLISSPLFQQGIAGFSMGYQSQSPVMGGLGGALSGLMAAGPVGAIVGGLAGAIGGLLGKSQAAREELERAKEAWKEMQDELKEFSEALRGEVIGELGESFRDARAQYREFAKAAKEAGENVNGLKEDLKEFEREQIADFNRGFGAVMRSLKTGLGDADPYLQSAQAIASLREELLGFIADTRRARGDAAVDRAKANAQEFVLRRITGAKEFTAVQEELRSINGARLEAIHLLDELGLSIKEATRRVNGAIREAINDLRQDFEADLRARLNVATGRGVFNEFQALIEQGQDDLKDAFRIGADWTLVGEVFAAEAQAIVDNGQIVGEAFDELIAEFPQLAGVVTEFAGNMESAAARLEAINRTAESIVQYVNNLRTGPNSTLSPANQFAAAQEAYNAQLILAQGGNMAAQSTITQYADDYLNAAKQMYASSVQFQEIFTLVQDQLLGLPAVQAAEDPVVVALREVLLGVDATTAAVKANTSVTSAGTSAITQAIDLDGDGQISKLEAAIAAIGGTTFAIDAQDPSIDATASALTDATDGIKRWSKNGAIVTNQFAAKIVPFYNPIEQRLREISQATADEAKRDRPPKAPKGDWTAPFSHGGIVGYASGAIVANGEWNVDSVRARVASGGEVMLAGGEGIINAAATRMIGPSMIDLINRTGQVPQIDNGRYFADQNRVIVAVGRATVEMLERIEGRLVSLERAANNTTRAVRDLPPPKAAQRVG